MFKKIKESADFIFSTTGCSPKVGIVLGTGLGGLVNEISIQHCLSYSEIPHFPLSTVESHSGKLIFGKMGDVEVVAMQGRFHFYEGYDMQEVVFPIRVMKLLGIKNLLISNASGGINPNFQKGDLMLIKDHINLFPSNPLIGKNIDEIGPRFPDMSEAYNKKLFQMTTDVAKELQLNLKSGVYAGLSGPMLETPAEYKFLGTIGADAVGMSTVPEVIAAVHAGISVLACSIITDTCYGEIQPVNIQEIIKTANSAEPKLTLLFKSVLEKLN